MGYNVPIDGIAPTPDNHEYGGPMSIESIQVGSVNILSISDCLMAVDACDFFPHKTSDAFRDFEGHVDEDCQVNGGINVASFLLESQGKRILVDAGLGPSPVAEAGGAAGNLLSEMRQGGIDPKTIDTVVITHLHFDHIGWLPTAMPDDSVRPTFPNAEYIIPKADWNLLFPSADAPRTETMEDFYPPADLPKTQPIEHPYLPAAKIFHQSQAVGRLLQKLDNLRLVEGDLNLTDEISHRPYAGPHPRPSEPGRHLPGQACLHPRRRRPPALANPGPPMEHQGGCVTPTWHRNASGNSDKTSGAGHHSRCGALPRPRLWTHHRRRNPPLLAAPPPLTLPSLVLANAGTHLRPL